MGHAGKHFGIVKPIEMNIYITSRGWIESWKSSAPVHVRGLENPVLCDVMWWVVSDIFSYGT